MHAPGQQCLASDGHRVRRVEGPVGEEEQRGKRPTPSLPASQRDLWDDEGERPVLGPAKALTSGERSGGRRGTPPTPILAPDGSRRRAIAHSLHPAVRRATRRKPPSDARAGGLLDRVRLAVTPRHTWVGRRDSTVIAASPVSAPWTSICSRPRRPEVSLTPRGARQRMPGCNITHDSTLDVELYRFAMELWERRRSAEAPSVVVDMPEAGAGLEAQALRRRSWTSQHAGRTSGGHRRRRCGRGGSRACHPRS